MAPYANVLYRLHLDDLVWLRLGVLGDGPPPTALAFVCPRAAQPESVPVPSVDGGAPVAVEVVVGGGYGISHVSDATRPDFVARLEARLPRLGRMRVTHPTPLPAPSCPCQASELTRPTRPPLPPRPSLSRLRE